MSLDGALAAAPIEAGTPSDGHHKATTRFELVYEALQASA